MVTRIGDTTVKEVTEKFVFCTVTTEDFTNLYMLKRTDYGKWRFLSLWDETFLISEYDSKYDAIADIIRMNEKKSIMGMAKNKRHITSVKNPYKFYLADNIYDICSFSLDT